MHISSHRMYDYLFSTHFIVFLGHVSVRRRLDVPNLNFFICFDHKEIVIPPLQAFVYTFAKVKTNLNSQNSYWLILLEAVFWLLLNNLEIELSEFNFIFKNNSYHIQHALIWLIFKWLNVVSGLFMDISWIDF